MQNTQFDLDNFNPDGMHIDDVCDWKEHFKQLSLLTANQVNADGFELASRYCDSKEKAMIARMAGDIKLALFHERNCDSIYCDLPDSLKW